LPPCPQRTASFASIAALADGNEVRLHVLPTLRLRHNVIQGQHARCATTIGAGSAKTLLDNGFELSFGRSPTEYLNIHWHCGSLEVYASMLHCKSNGEAIAFSRVEVDRTYLYLKNWLGRGSGVELSNCNPPPSSDAPITAVIPMTPIECG